MDQQKTGQFLKELRKEKKLTQSQFAEMMGVSNRTVSRWETGANMPDFDVIIEMADFHGVDVREILEGERSGSSGPQRKEDLLLVADYTNREKRNLSKIMRCLFSAGLLAMASYMVVDAAGGHEFVSSVLLGAVTGVLLIGVLFTTKYMVKIREFKLRLLNVKKGGGTEE